MASSSRPVGTEAEQKTEEVIQLSTPRPSEEVATVSHEAPYPARSKAHDHASVLQEAAVALISSPSRPAEQRPEADIQQATPTSQEQATKSQEAAVLGRLTAHHTARDLRQAAVPRRPSSSQVPEKDAEGEIHELTPAPQDPATAFREATAGSADLCTTPFFHEPVSLQERRRWLNKDGKLSRDDIWLRDGWRVKDERAERDDRLRRERRLQSTDQLQRDDRHRNHRTARKEPKQRVVHCTLISRDFGKTNPREEGVAFGGKKRMKKAHALVLTSKTTFNEFHRELLHTMHLLKMGDFNRPSEHGLYPGTFRPMTIMRETKPEDVSKAGIKKIFSRTKEVEVSRILKDNWEGSRKLLLEDEGFTVRVEAWTAPEDWDWYEDVRKIEKAKARKWYCAAGFGKADWGDFGCW